MPGASRQSSPNETNCAERGRNGQPLTILPGAARSYQEVPGAARQSSPNETNCPVCGCPRAPLLRYEDVCRCFRVSEQTVRRLVSCGGLTTVRVGKRVIRVHHASVHALLRRMESDAVMDRVRRTPAVPLPPAEEAQDRA